MAGCMLESAGLSMGMSFLWESHGETSHGMGQA